MRYQIIVAGRVDVSWGDWFDRMELLPHMRPDGSWVTSLTGDVTDQAALRGILNWLWDLNLNVISVRRAVAKGHRRRRQQRRNAAETSD
ncbi:MAG: hypothetical protein FJ026_10635 [Chloroflexi bacterium]|nr:hypothetical protein [Chloroflexota bacterium]